MNKKAIIAIVIIIVLILGSVWAYNWVLGPTAPPSEPIMAQPLEETAPPAQPAPAAQPAAELTMMRYTIAPENSKAQFTIYEELRGEPVNVVGVTDQVAGEVGATPADLSKSRVGVIKINARTLVTDNDRRNSAMRNRILNTDSHEYVTFTPTAITGLAGEAKPSTPYTFQITGDLAIRDVTRPVTFDATATFGQDKSLTGKAIARVKRSDFNLVVPNLPFLANVADDVDLEINIVNAPAAN